MVLVMNNILKNIRITALKQIDKFARVIGNLQNENIPPQYRAKN